MKDWEKKSFAYLQQETQEQADAGTCPLSFIL